jgi:hypothetical protein
VRWTEQRNFAAVLDLLADGRLDVKPLIGHRFAFEAAPAAYALLSNDKGALGILLEYPEVPAASLRARSVILPGGARAADPATPVCGFIGAGNYASRVLIPAFKAAGARCKTIVTSGGVSGVIHGRGAGFDEASTDLEAMLGDPAINTVAIVTRHHLHAPFVVKSLAAGKHVFVEKPLCLTLEELGEIEAVLSPLSPGPSPARGEGSVAERDPACAPVHHGAGGSVRRSWLQRTPPPLAGGGWGEGEKGRPC